MLDKTTLILMMIHDSNIARAYTDNVSTLLIKQHHTMALH